MHDDIPVRDLLIAWSFLRFLTPNRTRLLLEYFKPLERARDAPVRFLEGLLRIDESQAKLLREPMRGEVTAHVEAWRDRVITWADDAYPRGLRQIDDPPLVLYYRGNLELLQRMGVAIVGSRRASPYAVNVAAHLARRLAGAGLLIVSGGALGIDAAAHEAALDCGSGTAAVLGTGIDVVYPKAHRCLFQRIEKCGVIVSEFSPGAPPLKSNFPIRNRIISGLASGTVIVEATTRSGSLITARLSAEQGRDVFAVPGSVFSDGSEGTHRLIQYGAKLVHDEDDVLDEKPFSDLLQRAPRDLLNVPAEWQDVLESLSLEEPLHVDVAAMRLGRSVPQLARALLELELGGWVRALPGARYVRIKR
jgi:DNA processing protein